MISKKDVEHIGWLARIKLSDEEKEEFTGQLNTILDYFAKLDEIDPSVTPTHHVSGIENVFRDDVAKESLGQEDVLRNAPRKEEGFFKGPRIV